MPSGDKGIDQAALDTLSATFPELPYIKPAPAAARAAAALKLDNDSGDKRPQQPACRAQGAWRK